jgi:ankyrin repeat protein
MQSLDHRERCDAFLHAVCSNDVAKARTLLELEPSIADADIYCAAAVGNVELVRNALVHNPDVVAIKGGPLTREPILYACHSRLLSADDHVDGIVEVVRCLLETGANANTYFLQEGETNPDHRQTALYGAAGMANNEVLTRLLLEAGADPDDGARNSPGSESIYHAAEFEQSECLELLLDHAPSKAKVDYCLGRAIDFAYIEPAKQFLAHGADPNHSIPWNGNRTHFQKAIQNGRPLELIKAMIEGGADLEKEDDTGLTPYRFAIRYGRDDIAALLAEHGAKTTDVDALDRLLGACHRGDEAEAEAIAAAHPEAQAALKRDEQRALVDAANESNLAAMQILLDLGVPAEQGDEAGMSALHRACWRGDLASVQLLVAHGASLEKEHNYGGNALSTAMFASLNCHELDGGQTARMADVAPREYAEIVDLLLSAGAKPPTHSNASDAVVEVLLKRGIVHDA